MLSFSSDNVIVGVGEVKFVAIDDTLDTADSVWTDRLVLKISSDGTMEGVLEAVVLVAVVGKVGDVSTKKMILALGNELRLIVKLKMIYY